MRIAIIALIFSLAPGFCLADNDTRIAVIYKCTLNDDMTSENVMEANSRRLANVRKMAGTDEINSYVLEPKVGDFNHFMFIDSYPDMVTWATIQDADETEESKAIEDALEAAAKCEKNRLYESSKTTP